MFVNGGVNHVAFHMIPDLPEMLIRGREREYLTWFLTRLAYDVGAVTGAAIDECVRCLSMPGALRSTLGYTRAYFQDGQDNRAALAHGRLAIPVLAMGGSASIGTATAASVRQVAVDVDEDVIPDCGHWAADEQPAWLATRLIRFLEAHPLAG